MEGWRRAEEWNSRVEGWAGVSGATSRRGGGDGVLRNMHGSVQDGNDSVRYCWKVLLKLETPVIRVQDRRAIFRMNVRFLIVSM